MFSKTKKAISAVIAVILVLTISFIDVPAASAGTAKSGTVNTADSNLREAPSTASTVLAKMELGAKVSVLEDGSNGWYKIKYQNFTGYVRADFVDVAVTGLADMAVIMIDSPMTEQPDPASSVVETLNANALITVMGTYGAMYQIKAADSKSGYVLKSSVHKYRIMTIGLKAKVNSSGVNLRSTPNTAGQSLGVMKYGTSVTVISIADNWAKVQYSGKEGYIRGDFITYTVSDRITTMAWGMRAQAVKTVQMALKKKGLFYPIANGTYGNATRSAVKKFQQSVGLSDDGIAGRQTLLLLLGSEGASSLWNNYRAEMAPQKPQKNGKVYMVDWFDNGSQKGMQSIMKKYTPFKVIDVRTGIEWNMERFGDVTAHWHADVCPMTKSDTNKMIKAWGGKLNDSRRPVWVKYEGKYYAASLMGYVHNTSPIKDNGMDGQVCLHFRGSKIHASARIDESQQACIWEAFEKASMLND